MPVSFQNQDTKRIEFGQREAATELRNELPDDALLESDDGREKTLEIDKSKLDEDTLRRVEGKAAVSRDDARGDMHGQASLTDDERNRLDFTRTTVPEARTAKASLLAEGVSDWTAYFDPTLTTSEMADKARSTQASGGERLDSADTERARDRQGAEMFRQVQSSRGKRARDGCEEGFEEACDQLVEEFGYSRQEAEALMMGRQPAQAGQGVTADGGLVDTTVLRSGAAGTFLRQPPEPADDAPGYRNGSTGRFVGYEIDEHDDAKRSPETGRIKRLGAAEPVPRDEAINRWGHPDGADRDPTPTDDRPSTTDVLFGAGERMSPTEDVAAQARARDLSFNPGGEPADSAVADAPGGVAFNRDSGFRETDRVGEEQRPPEPALLDQSRRLERTRREDAAESAGVFDRAPDELPGGFEQVDERSRQGGDLREVEFRREDPAQPFDDVIEVQEIQGDFSINTGVDDGSGADLGGFSGGTVSDAETAFIQAEQRADSLVSDPSDGSDVMSQFTDTRDEQGTLSVGQQAGATEGRSGQVAGSAGFEDRRDELGTTGTPDMGEQSGLVEMETDVGGDGQTDLFGNDASETSGAEYRL
jgi:hypothetical protein